MVKQKKIEVEVEGEVVESEITETADELRDALNAVGNSIQDKDKLLSSGFVPLNLASTNSHRGFIAPGEFCVIFGDSSSGKTWLYLQILAEAANNPNFKNYRLIVDNSENGIGMDIERYFGKKLAQRIEPPARESDGDQSIPRDADRVTSEMCTVIDYKCREIFVKDSIAYVSWVLAKMLYKMEVLTRDAMSKSPTDFEEFLQNEIYGDLIKNSGTDPV